MTRVPPWPPEPPRCPTHCKPACSRQPRRNGTRSTARPPCRRPRGRWRPRRRRQRRPGRKHWHIRRRRRAYRTSSMQPGAGGRRHDVMSTRCRQRTAALMAHCDETTRFLLQCAEDLGGLGAASPEEGSAALVPGACSVAYQPVNDSAQVGWRGRPLCNERGCCSSSSTSWLCFVLVRQRRQRGQALHCRCWLNERGTIVVSSIIIVNT